MLGRLTFSRFRSKSVELAFNGSLVHLSFLTVRCVRGSFAPQWCFSDLNDIKYNYLKTVTLDATSGSGIRPVDITTNTN